jgi:hypothetical protein
MLKSSSLCLYSSNLGTFWFKIEQFWPFEEIYIFSNSGHLEWSTGLSDTILKGTHPGTIPARLGLIWFSGFRGEDLNVIFYQNMPNLHNWYISAERKISQKNPEYMLNYFLPCSCSYNLYSFWLTLKQQWTIKISSPFFSILSLAAILIGNRDHRTQFWKGIIQESFQQSLVEIGSVVSEKIFFLNSSTLFSNLHNRSKSASVQSS